MARALGSYPGCRWFKSNCRYQMSACHVKNASAQIWPVGQAVKTPPFHGGNMGSIPVRVTNYVSRKCLFYGVCEFFFCSISALATYLPLIFENCHLHCHLCFCKRLFFISKRKCISNRFTVSRLRFLKHMTIDITRCSYAGMSHIT